MKKTHLLAIAAIMLGLVACGGGNTAAPVASDAGASAALDFSAPAANSAVSAPLASPAPIQGMWVWNTNELLASTTLQAEMITKVKAAGITDVYLYVDTSIFADVTKSASLKTFNTALKAKAIKVWGLDGCRCYFSDMDGPTALYQDIDALIAFNKSVPSAARFVGFMADQEPQDHPGYPLATFHNELADSQLSTTTVGVWKATPAADREALMLDWVTFFETARTKLKAANLRTGGSMVFWVDNYVGEPVQVTYGGVRKPVSQHLMRFIDDYVVMTYNVDPANAAGRATSALAYASSLPALGRPRVSASMETHTLGEPNTVSYADVPAKNFKSVVLQDRTTMRNTLSTYSAFGGISLHDYVGWKAMPD
jgi:hypothetical protein